MYYLFILLSLIIAFLSNNFYINNSHGIHHSGIVLV